MPAGVEVELDGVGKIRLMPMVTGQSGDEIADALDALAELGEQNGVTNRAVNRAINRLAMAMLTPLYDEAEARRLADQIPAYWAEGLISVARRGRLPADFTTAGAPGSGSPGGTGGG